MAKSPRLLRLGPVLEFIQLRAAPPLSLTRGRIAWKFIAALLALSSVLFAGCAREGSPFSTQPEIAARQLNALLPKGTSDARAKSILSHKGFTLSRLDSKTADGHLLVASCSRQNHTWLVGLVIVDQRVVASSVTITKDP